jgi:broad specificity phosphatase PhoE
VRGISLALLGTALLLLLAGAPPSRAAPSAGVAGDSATTSVIIVRHAEKNAHPPGGDAGLAPRGTLRALELARVLEDAGVSAVFVSQYGRARLTGEPLARALGDSVRTYDANRNDLLAARIRGEYAGATVLVVGHGDSVPELIEALTGERLLANEAVDYDRLYVLTLGPGDRHHLLRLRYGSRPG